MKVLSFPFKLTVLPAKFALGFLGVFAATVLNVWAVYFFCVWGQGNLDFMQNVFRPVISVVSVAAIAQFAAFCLSLYAAYGND